jgi:hypothetical protein
MAGIKALRKLQFGREGTAGTAVAATTIWRGMGTIHNKPTVTQAEEDVGILLKPHRTYIPKHEASISLDSVPATYQQLLHILEAGVASVTPAADGAGDGFIYTYPFPTTTVPTIKTYTIEGGDNQQAEEMEYAFVQSFSISGNNGEGLMMSAEWLGRQVTKTTFTGALTLPSVEEVLFQRMKLYIDDVGDGFGTTQVSNTLLNMTFDYTTGLIPKYTADGNLYFSFVQQTAPTATLNVTFEHNTDAVAEKDAFLANTPRAIRLIAEGSAFGTGGTEYDNHTLILDMVGVYTEFSALGEVDGNDIYDATLTLGYDGTLASAGEIVVVNELSAVQ